VIVRCAGFNEKNIHPNLFKQYFIGECRIIGGVRRMADLGNVMIAEVER